MKVFLKFMALIFLPVIAVFLIMYTFFQSNIYSMIEEGLLKEMKSKWEIIDYSLMSLNKNESQKYIRNISSSSPTRITIIDKKGVVLDDSYFKRNQISEIKNHLMRPEVQEAFNKGEGTFSRYSTTAGQEMFYYARVRKNGLILRLSYPMEDIALIKKRISAQNFAYFAAVLVILTLVVAYVARRLSLPMIKIKSIVESIEAGDKPQFPVFKDDLMDKVAGLIYRTFNAVNSQKEQTEHEKRKISRLLDILEEGIIHINSHDKIIIANPQAEVYTGSKLQPGVHLVDSLKDVDSLAFFKNILDSKEDRNLTKQMGHLTFEVYVRNVDSTRLIVFVDITERIKYESYKSNLISNISHELKTPLAMIMGYAETISSYKDMEREKMDKFISKIYSGSTQLNNILNDVLQLLKLESTQEHEFQKEDIDVHGFIEELREYYGNIDSHQISFSNSCDNIVIYRGHLMSLLTNLIDNAVNYSEGETIDVSISCNSSGYVITVADEGPAIPAQERTRIFERFYTISESRNRAHSGTGLGLSIVKHICKLYKGNIALSENEKGGNTFTIKIFP